MSTADHFRSEPDTAEWTIRYVPETGSTNTDLLAEADAAPDRSVLRTGHQTAGKGRLDRRWDAPPGTNLLVSLLFRDASNPGELVRRVGLAVVDASSEFGVDARLKWPNDVVVGGEKLAGVLAQRAPNGALVVGTGVNLGWAPSGAARLGDIDPGRFLLCVLRAFDALPTDIGERYRSALVTLGQRVRVIRPADELVGRAIDVDGDGRLVVVDECAISHRVDVGDIVHLRPD